MSLLLSSCLRAFDHKEIDRTPGEEKLVRRFVDLLAAKIPEIEPKILGQPALGGGNQPRLDVDAFGAWFIRAQTVGGQRTFS